MSNQIYYNTDKSYLVNKRVNTLKLDQTLIAGGARVALSWNNVSTTILDSSVELAPGLFDLNILKDGVYNFLVNLRVENAVSAQNNAVDFRIDIVLNSSEVLSTISHRFPARVADNGSDYRVSQCSLTIPLNKNDVIKIDVENFKTDGLYIEALSDFKIHKLL